MPIPAPASDAAATNVSTLPPTCSIKGLVAFGPGVFKGEIYTPARCRQITANFQKYRDRTPALARIGHDKQQRFSKSLGFPNVGRVSRCEPIGDSGCFDVDIDAVPTEVGGEVNAGRLCGSSVELKSHERDPDDPAREIPGDILTGIALLGEEQQCVRNWPPELRAKAKPVATFADGTLVPANPNPARWLNAMADVTAQMAAEVGGEFEPVRQTLKYKGREYSAATACFSDFTPPDTTPVLSSLPAGEQDSTKESTPMTPEEIQAKLTAAGKTPDEIAAIMAALTSAPAPAPAPVVPATNPTMSEMCKKYALDEKSSSEQVMSAMYADFSKKFADWETKDAEKTKRIGELQTSAEAGQKKDAEAQMAAFSDRVQVECKKIAAKVAPTLLESVVKPTAMNILTAKTFAAETDRVKAFSDFFAGYAALPDDPRLAKPHGPAVNIPTVLNPETLATLKHLSVTNPRSVARLTAAPTK